MKSKTKRIIITLASAAIICSSVYLLYDSVWVPFHFKSLTDELNVSENAAVSTPQGDLKIQRKYRFIKNKYPDYSGRLVIDGLGVDFPVAQCENNNYYLRRTLDGEKDKHGTLFADFRNNLEELDMNTIIYGHNMKDGTQFGLLNVYKKVSGYKRWPVVTFSTVYKDYQWKIFAAFLINTKAEDDDGYVFDYMKTNFSSEAEFSDFYNEVMERSYFITDTDVSYNDKILTMSTCSTLFDNSRLVVMARLLRDGESGKADTSSARANPGQRFPSAFQ